MIYRKGARRWKKVYKINGHTFQAKRFNKHATCVYCHDRIWGLGRQGFKCSQCKLLIHKKCHKFVTETCGDIASKINKDENGSKVNLLPNIQNQDGAIAADNVDSADQGAAALVEPAGNSDASKISLADFDLIKVLGRGSYAKVLMVEYKKTKRVYALKVIKKEMFVSIDDDDENEIDWVHSEKMVFERATNHPFLVGLHSCFQTPERLFFVIEFVQGGDLTYLMQCQSRLPEKQAQFYAAELSLALNFLHVKGIIYRDLKLDNILLDHEGHIKLTDFGMCKVNLSPGEKANTFCGTPNYMAPEILQGEEYSFSVDWWALGVVLFEMLAGRSPFQSSAKTDNLDQDTEDYIFELIKTRPVRPPRSLSAKACAMLKGFLNQNPEERLGCHPDHGFQEIMDHPFFKNLIWEDIELKQVTPPYRPSLENERDLANFPTDFTDEPVIFTPPEDPEIIEKIDQSEFDGFEYVNPLLMSAAEVV